MRNQTVLFKPIFPDEVKRAWKAKDIHLVPDWMKRLSPLFIQLLTKELGAAGAWVFTDAARTDLLSAVANFETASFKMALFLSTSNLGAGSTTYPATDEHAEANGYLTGGIAVALSLTGTTTVKVDIDTDPVWTANGGSIVAKYAAIYEVAGNIVCYCQLESGGADVTVTTGNTLTVAAHASGVFDLA